MAVNGMEREEKRVARINFYREKKKDLLCSSTKVWKVRRKDLLCSPSFRLSTWKGREVREQSHTAKNDLRIGNLSFFEYSGPD